MRNLTSVHLSAPRHFSTNRIMMFHALTEEQRLLRSSINRFMKKHCSPEYLDKLDRDARYPYELYAGWAELGLLGCGLPAQYGGSDGGIEDLALIAESLAYWSYDVSTAFTVPLFTAMTVLRWGNETQRACFMPGLADGTLRFAVCISEPDAGSDAGKISTRAYKRDGKWVISGQKLWITGAGAADTLLLVYVRTSDDPDHRRAFSALLVNNDAPGIRIRKLDTLGRRSVGTYEVHFDDAVVEESRLLGAAGQGWEILLSGLQVERALTAAAYAGACRRVVDVSTAYAKERKQFGRAIGEFQAISHMVADMRTQATAARLFAYYAASRLSRGEDALQDVACAKLFGSEAYVALANMGMQIMGAYGYSMEFEMQRHLRDARSTTIGAGSSQIQRNIIASKMGLRVRNQ